MSEQRFNGFLISALCWAMTVFAVPAAAEDGEVLREEINRGTVGIISGGIDGTYIRIATDLASVLDQGADLRVLPIMGKGSVQNIDDILYLRGIDIGIVQSDVFAFVKRQNRHATIDRRINYITKLYNEEFHLLAGPGIDSVEQLAGMKVNFGVQGSGTFMTASIVFETLGIEVEPVSYDQGLALEKVKSGEIGALVYVAGKPTQLFKSIENSGDMHFLRVPLTESILETYLPSRFTHEDYPQLVPEGQQVQTLAVGAVMAVYNWPADHPRHSKVSKFIDAFFSRFSEFQQTPRHRKWREVSLTAVVPGWSRFEPAEDWLRINAIADSESSEIKAAFDSFLKQEAPALANQLTTEQDKLFELFLLWQAKQEQ